MPTGLEGVYVAVGEMLARIKYSCTSAGTESHTARIRLVCKNAQVIVEVQQ